MAETSANSDRRRGMARIEFPPGFLLGLNSELASQEAGIDSGVLDLQVQDQAIIQKSLDMKGDLDAGDGAVIGEEKFDGNVEASVVIGVNIEIESHRKKCRGIDEKIYLREVLRQSGSIGGHLRELL